MSVQNNTLKELGIYVSGQSYLMTTPRI